MHVCTCCSEAVSGLLCLLLSPPSPPQFSAVLPPAPLSSTPYSLFNLKACSSGTFSGNGSSLLSSPVQFLDWDPSVCSLVPGQLPANHCAAWQPE